MINLGKVKPGSTIRIPFGTFAASTGASSAASSYAASDIQIYKDGSTTQRASSSGITATTDFDSLTGINWITIDLSDNTTADFYAAGSEYIVVVADITVDTQTLRFPAARFTIAMDGAILDTTIATLSSQTSFTLAAGPADNNALVGCVAYIHDAASAVQCAMGVVSAYTGSTKTVTLAVDPAVFTMAAKDNISFLPRTNVYAFGGTTQTAKDVGAAVPAATAGATGGLLIAGSNAATTFATLTSTGAFTVNGTSTVAQTGDSYARIGAAGAGLTAIGDTRMANLDAAVTSRMATYTQPTGFLAATFPATVASTTNITAGTITTVTNLTNAPTSGDFTATMKTSIGTAVAASAVASVTGNVGGNVVGSVASVVGAVGSVTGLTNATIAAATWDLATSGHTTSGTFGAAMSAAGSAGDPWSTAVPGAYSAGTAGYILGTNLNATVSSRLPTASYTAPLDASGTRNAMGLASANLDTQLDALPTATENADALLKRDWTAVTGEAARSVLNALRFLRNKWAVSGTTLSVYKEDDSTSAWTGTVTSSASADPVTGNDPS